MPLGLVHRLVICCVPRRRLDQLIISTAPNGFSVSVLVVDRLELGLMGVFVDQTAPLTVTAEATAVPVLVP